MDPDELVGGARAQIAEVADLDGLAAIERDFLGKKGRLPALKKALGGLDAEDRRAAGQQTTRPSPSSAT